MREELEKERKRRMEEMSDGLDEDFKMTSEAKKGVNEELLHLFAFHDVSLTGILVIKGDRSPSHFRR